MCVGNFASWISLARAAPTRKMSRGLVQSVVPELVVGLRVGVARPRVLLACPSGLREVPLRAPALLRLQ
eukprot:9344453-Alexandrium_andersonii.AAC.1